MENIEKKSYESSIEREENLIESASEADLRGMVDISSQKVA